jgi:hypothetical protein
MAMRAQFAPLETMWRLPSRTSLDDTQRPMDLSADGRLDVVALAEPDAGYFERTAAWTWAPLVRFQSLPQLDWMDKNVTFVDLTGDGFADILLTEDGLYTLWASRPQQSFSGSSVALPKQSNVQRLFSLKHEFPSEWYRFLHPADTASNQSMQIALDNARFPFQYRGMTIPILQAELVLLFSNPQFQSAYQGGSPLVVTLGPAGGGAQSSVTLKSPSILSGAGYDVAQPAKPTASGPNMPPGWVLQATSVAVSTTGVGVPVTTNGVTYHHINPDAIADLLLICDYKTS